MDFSTFCILPSLVSLDNCIRQEKGYCRIQWRQKAASYTAIDVVTNSFQLDTIGTIALAIAAGGIQAPAIATICDIAYVQIPDGSFDGIAGFPAPLSDNAFQSQYCGGVLGVSGSPVSNVITCKSTFK